MAPPVAAFTVIPLADVDPDSPVTTDLMDALRLNDQNLFAQLVGDPVAAPPFTPAAAHNHDGVNSAAVAGANLRFVGSTEISGGAVASVSFSGLDGNTDGLYVLYGTVVPGSNFTDLRLQFNALATSYLNTDDALITGIFIEAAATAGIGEFVHFKAQVYARNSIQGVDILPGARIESMLIDAAGGSPSVARSENVGARASVSLPAPNITSLDLDTATGATPFGNGSRFALYKLAET